MMLLDVVIDPLAVRGDRWFLGRIFYYPEPGGYFGVPVSNFAGWVVVGATIVLGWQVLRAVDRGRPAATGGAWYRGRGPLLRGPAVQPDGHRLDRRARPAGGGNPASRPARDRCSSFWDWPIACGLSVCASASRSDGRGRAETAGAHGGSGFADVDGRDLRARAEAARAEALSAGADARAAVPLQPGLRRLRQDPVPGPHPQASTSRPSSASRPSTSAARPMVVHPRRRAAAAPEIDEIVEAWSRARSTSTSAPTPCCSRRSSRPVCSSRQQVPDLQRPHGRAPGRATTSPSAATATYDKAVEGDPSGAAAGLPRHHQHHALRRRRSRLRMRQFFDEMMELGVEGMMVSPRLQLRQGARPGALPAGAADARTASSPMILSNRKKRLEVQPVAAVPASSSWASATTSARPGAMPTYNIFGWQKPCYLLQDGYVERSRN